MQKWLKTTDKFGYVDIFTSGEFIQTHPETKPKTESKTNPKTEPNTKPKIETKMKLFYVSLHNPKEGPLTQQSQIYFNHTRVKHESRRSPRFISPNSREDDDLDSNDDEDVVLIPKPTFSTPTRKYVVVNGKGKVIGKSEEVKQRVEKG